MHRGLRLTRAKEVAKWRICTSRLATSRPPKSFEVVFGKLQRILDASLQKLKDGDMDDNPRVNVPATVESEPSLTPTKQHGASVKPRSYSDHEEEVEQWMEETSPTLPTAVSSYDRIMDKWLDVRSRLRDPRRTPATASEADVVLARCPVCDEKLRCCLCDSCDICGELTADFGCEKCSICSRVDGHCQCVLCEECGEKIDSKKKTLCACFCLRCERAYSFIGDGCASDDACACIRNIDDERKIRRDLLRKKKAWQAGHQHRECRRLHTVMHKWILEHRPGYYNEQRRLLLGRGPRPGRASGSYVLLSGETSVTERQELLITAHNRHIIGRFRYAEDIHGLFIGGEVPRYASTAPTFCNVAADNPVQKDGRWISGAMAALGTAPEVSSNPPGITFLGKGLIKVSPHFFRDSRGSFSNDGFGIKVSDYCEEYEALKQSWDAVREKFPPISCDDWPLGNERTTLEWNEELVDSWVQRFCRMQAP